jgi:hypothetical protein
MARPRPSMAPVYLACLGIASVFVGVVVALGYLLR